MNTFKLLTPLFTGLGLGLLMLPQAAQATACMVLGQASAIVQTDEGRKSPIFHASNCDALRLVQGKAMASWVSRDGKAQMVPITESGVAQMPKPGAEERSSKVVWDEMTKTRETHRAAYMRVLTTVRPTKFYLPKNGVDLASPGEGKLSLYCMENGEPDLLEERDIADGQLIRLTRENIEPNREYLLRWSGNGKNSETRLKLLPDQKIEAIDAEWARIEAELSDPAQQNVMIAMLFDQLKLPINTLLALEGDQAMLELPAPGQEPN